MLRSTQIHRRETTQELGGESPAPCTGSPLGYEANLKCVLEEEAHGIPYQKEPKYGEGEKMMASLFKS